VATTRTAAALLACPKGDKDCLDKLSTNKLGGGGQINNQFRVLMVSSETLIEGDRALASLRLLLHNPTAEDLTNFKVPVSLASVLQGDGPLQAAPIYEVQIERLAANETALFYVNGMAPTLSEGATFWCLFRRTEPPQTAA
jgi:hypothetical protein